jgi:transcriptional regulator with XRE-family HTH domain
MLNPMITAKELGHIMRNARRLCGLSQREVAERMGVNQATLSRYEHGESTPNVLEWFTFCSITEIFPDLPWSGKLFETLIKDSPDLIKK